MSKKIFQAKAFLNYWLDAVDEHSLHSPFFFDFYINVVKGKANQNAEGIESLRHKLLADQRGIKVSDLGSGNHSKRLVADIAATSLSPARFSQLYARIIDHFKSKTVVELGTSLGINSLYLAQKKDVQVTTFEGSPEIAEIASITFDFAHASNVNIIKGNIDTTLPLYLQSVRKIDFVHIDANHRYQPTVKYFEWILPRLKETSVLVVDDIHRSDEMEQAWNLIKNSKLVYGSADLYRCGIVFFDPSLNKQHVILQF